MFDFKNIPPVVKNLLIINGLFYLASLVLFKSQGIDLSDYLGLHYWESPGFKPHQLITHMFSLTCLQYGCLDEYSKVLGGKKDS